MGESSFWYRPTRVVPDQRPLNGRCCLLLYLYLSNLYLKHYWFHFFPEEPFFPDTVYVGKSKADTVPELAATGNLVTRMLTGLENKGHIVYMNRFYTSHTLYRYLSHNGFDACGTALTNRKQFPQVIMCNKRNMKRGECLRVFSKYFRCYMDGSQTYIFYVDVP